MSADIKKAVTKMTAEQIVETGLIDQDSNFTDLGKKVGVHELLIAYKEGGYQNERYVIKKLKSDGVFENVGGKITLSLTGKSMVLKKWILKGINQKAFDQAVQEQERVINDAFDIQKKRRSLPGVTRKPTRENSAAFDFIEEDSEKEDAEDNSASVELLMEKFNKFQVKVAEYRQLKAEEEKRKQESAYAKVIAEQTAKEEAEKVEAEEDKTDSKPYGSIPEAYHRSAKTTPKYYDSVPEVDSKPKPVKSNGKKRIQKK